MAMTWLYACLVVFLVVFAGLMSGLTLGLMSQDVMDLKVLERSGSPKEVAYAKKILPVVENPHFTLVTLLLCNAIAVECYLTPLYVNWSFLGFLKGIAEKTYPLFNQNILEGGEIIPQAMCCRYGLVIGAYSAGFVMFLRRITFPISWPISKVLDWAIGANHTAIFKRPELKALVALHSGLEGLGGALSQDEVNVILGALDMQSKKVASAMTPLDKVFMLSEDEILNKQTFDRVVKTGHSRIPVHSKHNTKDIIGLILVKELVVIDVSANMRVKQLKIRSIPHLPSTVPMYDVLNLFKTGRSHMAVLTLTEASHTQMMDWNSVTNAGRAEPIGIVTIEDLIEELLQGEIVDETDQFVDNLQTARVNASIMTNLLPPNVKHWLKQYPPLATQRSWRNVSEK